MRPLPGCWTSRTCHQIWWKSSLPVQPPPLLRQIHSQPDMSNCDTVCITFVFIIICRKNATSDNAFYIEGKCCQFWTHPTQHMLYAAWTVHRPVQGCWTCQQHWGLAQTGWAGCPGPGPPASPPSCPASSPAHIHYLYLNGLEIKNFCTHFLLVDLSTIENWVPCCRLLPFSSFGGFHIRGLCALPTTALS